MQRIDAELAADGKFRKRVDARLNEMRREQELTARRERYLVLSAKTARQLDAKGITEKKLRADFELFKERRQRGRGFESHAAARKRSDSIGESALDRARQGERVVVRRGGRTIAAVVPIADLRLLQKLEDREDLRDIRAARIEMKRKGTIPWEKVKAELEPK